MAQIEKPSTTAIAKGFVEKSLSCSNDEAIIANLLLDSTEEIEKIPCVVRQGNFADCVTPSDEGCLGKCARIWPEHRIGKFPFKGQQCSPRIVRSQPLNRWSVRRVADA